MNNSYIEVDMQILRENMASIASTLTPGAGIIPVLKDDAYGLGLVPVAHVLEPLDCVRCFSVSHVSEGLELRRGGISKGILVMNSALPFQLEAAVEAGLSLACGRPGFVTELQAAARAVGKTAHIHIKIDMYIDKHLKCHALALSPERSSALLSRSCARRAMI